MKLVQMIKTKKAFLVFSLVRLIGVSLGPCAVKSRKLDFKIP